jgi:hypothetical protein
MSLLKPDQSVVAALATAAVVYGTYQAALPSVTDVRTADPGDPDVAGAERAATFIAAGVVGTVSLLTKDPTVFIVGGGVLVAMALLHRHANLMDPVTGIVQPLTGHAHLVDPDDDGE